MRTLYARVKKNEKRIKTFITLRILYGFSQFFFCWIQNIFLDKLSKFHNFLLRTLYARAKNEKRIKTFITLRIVYGFSQFFFVGFSLFFCTRCPNFIIFHWELSTPELKNQNATFLHIGNHKNIHNFSNSLWIFIIFFLLDSAYFSPQTVQIS